MIDEKPPKKRWNPLVVVLLLSGGFFFLFMVISGALFFTRSSKDWGQQSGPKIFITGGSKGVGVVEVKGVIMDSKKTLRQLRRFEEDDRIGAIVLRLNSPGGSVAPSQEIYEAVKKFPKPVIASMDSIAASGAYYIACGAKKVFANAGTLTGSIGVIMEFANLKKLYEWAKIERYAVKTGKFKDVGAEYREMSAEEKQFLQNLVDDVLAQFKEAVATGRKLSLERVTQIADGRIFTGSQAKQNKLVDELGTLQDAIQFAANEAKISGKPKVYYPEEHKPRILEFLMDRDRDDDDVESGRSYLRDLVGDVVLRALGVQGQGSSGLKLQPGVYWLWNGAR